MGEHHIQRVHSEHVVLDIGGNIGALIIYTRAELVGKEIEVSIKGTDGKRTHTDVHERRIADQPIFAAVFPELPEGEYTIWDYDPKPVNEVNIRGGEIAEVDWR